MKTQKWCTGFSPVCLSWIHCHSLLWMDIFKDTYIVNSLGKEIERSSLCNKGKVCCLPIIKRKCLYAVTWNRQLFITVTNILENKLKRRYLFNLCLKVCICDHLTLMFMDPWRWCTMQQWGRAEPLTSWQPGIREQPACASQLFLSSPLSHLGCQPSKQMALPTFRADHSLPGVTASGNAITGTSRGLFYCSPG